MAHSNNDDEPFFVPSDSSNEDEMESNGAYQGVRSSHSHSHSHSSGSSAYKASPVHRLSVPRPGTLHTTVVPSRDGTAGTAAVHSSFSPELPTTTTTGASSSSSSSAVRLSVMDAEPDLTRTRHSPRSHMSMDDLLFGSAEDRRAALKRRQTGQQQQQQHARDVEKPVTTDGGADARDGEVDVSASAEPAVSDAASGDVAGGDVMALPLPCPPPQPKTLEVLRGMTSADVRGVLESFFVKKEAWERQFQGVERQVLPELFLDRTARAHKASDASASASASSTTAAAAVDVVVRDRCARLVNTRNWSSSHETTSTTTAMPNVTLDVLLPAALVPWSPWHRQGVAATAALPSAASPSPQQQHTITEMVVPATAPPIQASSASPPRCLRRHQVEGIRFMWNTLVEAPVGQVPAVGSILAHTMGLGKTGQVVVFLHLFMQRFHTAPPQKHASRPTEGPESTPNGGPPRPPSRGGDAPHAEGKPQRVLIVVPKSTIGSWVREFEVWSVFFAPAHRVRLHTITDRLTQADRLRAFYTWRRHGGVLLVGYESFVRIMEQVEAESAFDGLGDASSTFGLHHRAGASEKTGAAAARRDEEHAAAARRMAMARRRDEGDVTYGGRDDPFTELVICDEAHRLKSVHLRTVAALRGLHPLRRLLLTGTPLQNHLQEYWSMMDFCLHKYFDRLRFKNFFSDSIESSVTKLASSDEVQLARNKTFTLINEVRHFVQRVDSAPLRSELPPLHECVVVLKLSPLQKQLYTEFIRSMQKRGADVLSFLPAVAYAGKITAHPKLFYDKTNGAEEEKSSHRATTMAKKRASTRKKSRTRDKKKGSVKTRNRKRARGKDSDDDDATSDAYSLPSGDDELSAVDVDDSTSSSSSSSSSSDDVDDTRSATKKGRGSRGAEETGEAWAVLQKSSKYSLSSLYRTAVHNKKLHKPADYKLRLEDGVKLHAAILIIQTAMQTGEKTLLFSLSTHLLDLVEVLIAQYNVTGVQDGSLTRPIRYCRLDGSSTSAERATSLKLFDSADGPDVFLLSTKAGGVGITITAATRVILVDTSFNPADDQQAIGRAYRYGQTKPVFVYRLLCLHTIEYSIFEQKLAKEWLFQTIVEENSVKRDGLSGQGMHLRQIFNLMSRTVEALHAPITTTAQQKQQTARAMQDDPLLTALASLLISAQRYEFFLERDTNDTYGDTEKAYYDAYQMQRPFNVDELSDEAALWRQRAQEQRAAQEAAEQSQLQHQSRSLSHLVDDLIRSRVEQDPHLARLLAAMGVRVEASTGTVQPSERLLRHEQEPPQRHSVPVGERPREDAQAISSPPAHPHALGESPALARPALNEMADETDSDVEELNMLLTPNAPVTARPSRDESKSVSERILSQPSVVTHPALYARYAPGRTPQTAIELDEEE